MSSATRAAPASFAALVQAFFTEHLTQQRAMSPRTVAAYRDAFVLFLGFAQARLQQAPCGDAAGRHHAGADPGLPRSSGAGAAQRGAQPQCAAGGAARVPEVRGASRRGVAAHRRAALGVPMKRFERPMLGFLTREEMLAVIGTPGTSWTSQRDHLLLGMLYNTGARVSEIIGVRVADVVLDGAACVHLHGKGRKQRSVPLWRSTVEGDPGVAAAESAARSDIGPAAQPRRPAMTRDNVTQRLALAVRTAATVDARPGQAAHLAAHHPSHDGDAPAAVGRRHQT